MAYAFGDPKHVPQGSTRNIPIASATESALLVVDVQKYASIPNSGCHEGVSRQDLPEFFSGVDRIVPNIAMLLESARKSGSEVIYTYIECLTTDGRDSSLDYKLSGPLFVAKGSTGAEMVEGIEPDDAGLTGNLHVPSTVILFPPNCYQER